MNSLRHLLERARVAYRESGPLGVARRAGRLGLGQVRQGVAAAERSLFYAEARSRLSDEARQAAAATAALRDSRRGQRAFILATGPSLNAPGLDLRPLADEVTFGVNSFYLHPIVQQWQPTYLAMMDYAFFINGNATDSFFTAANRALPRSEFFVPAEFIPTIRQHAWLPLERVHGVAMDGDFCEHDWDDIDPNLLPATPNVLMFALAMAVHMGCSPIVLLGADNSWLARPLRGPDPIQHFYTRSDLTLPPNAIRTDFDDYHQVISYCGRLWRGYKNLRRIAAARGLQIVNATEDSYLDVFPMTTLPAVLAAR